MQTKHQCRNDTDNAAFEEVNGQAWEEGCAAPHGGFIQEIT